MALLLDAVSQTVANLPAGTEEPAVTIPNFESHVVRLVGDTDHWTTLEAGAKRVPNRNGFEAMETDGGRERAENSGSEIRDAASRCHSPGMSDNPAKFEENLEVVGTPGGCLRKSFMFK